jgi:hypothetical protein
MLSAAAAKDLAAKYIDGALWQFHRGLQRELELIAVEHPAAEGSLRRLSATVERDLYPALHKSFADFLANISVAELQCSTEPPQLAPKAEPRSAERIFPAPPPKSLWPPRERPQVIAEDSVSLPTYRPGSSYR